MATTQDRFQEAGVLRIRVAREDHRYLIALSGELDLSNAKDVEAELKLAEESDAAEIMLDLNGLEFIDSTGLRSLMNAKRRSDAGSRRLRVRPGGDQVARVMAITGIDGFLGLDAASDHRSQSEGGGLGARMG